MNWLKLFFAVLFTVGGILLIITLAVWGQLLILVPKPILLAFAAIVAGLYFFVL